MKKEDETMRRASELLLAGATMLQIACPQCHDPIYKLRDGTMECAQCMQQVFFERELSDSQKKEIGNRDNPIRRKIDALSSQLEKEEDPDKIIKLAETIKKLKDIL